MTDPRLLAFTVLHRVEDGAFADLALDGELSAVTLERRDRALATELVYGVLRLQGRLDHALAPCCSQTLAKLEPGVRRLLRLGAYQLLQLDRVPAHAAVSTTVELARRTGLGRACGFVNAVLRTLERQRESFRWPDPASEPLPHLIHRLSLPGWLARRWLAQFGAVEAIALAEALLLPAPFTLRANTLRISREELLARLATAGHQARPCQYAPEGILLEARGEEPLPGDAEGWYQVQDQASMLIAHLLGAREEERILDVCAAPGGKTTQLAALTGNRAQIVATDTHPQRVELIRQGCARLGCTGVEPRCQDMTLTPDWVAPGSFDRALLDAPCSGLGVLRRNPELRWRRTAADLPRLAQLQRAILDQAAELVRPGGTLLYAVCTLTPEETDGVVDGFLAAHSDWAPEPLTPLAPPAWAELFDGAGRFRSLPHRHDRMDAFFAARLRRTDS